MKIKKTSVTLLITAFALLLSLSILNIGKTQTIDCSSFRCTYLAFVNSLPAPTATPTLQPTIAPTATSVATPIVNTPIPDSKLPKFINADFEQGHKGWEESPRNSIISQTSRVTPHSGEWLAHFAQKTPTYDLIQQTITLPNVTPLYLSHYRWIYTGSSSGNISDFSISVNGKELSNETVGILIDTDLQWQRHTIDISEFAGQTVLVEFALIAGEEVEFYIDDISLSQTP